MDLSIIIVNWNTRYRLQNCLNSISNLSLNSYEIIVIDNASSDDSVQMIRNQYPYVKLITNKENVGFAKACNQGINAAQAEYILLLNPDVIVPQGAIEKILDVFKKIPDLGIIGCGLSDEYGTIQRSVFPFPTPTWDIFSALGCSRLLKINEEKLSYGVINVKGFLTGAFMLVRRQAINDVGLLDDNIFIYGEDVEWCYRFYKANWNIGYLPDVSIIHIGNESGKQAFDKRKRLELVYRGIMYFQQKYFPHYHKFGPYVRAYGLAIKIIVSLPLSVIIPYFKKKLGDYIAAFIANYRATFGR